MTLFTTDLNQALTFYDWDNQRFASIAQYVAYRQALLFDGEVAANVVLRHTHFDLHRCGDELAQFDYDLWQDRHLSIIVQGMAYAVGQDNSIQQSLLATEGKVLSGELGSLWMVVRESMLEHQ